MFDVLFVLPSLAGGGAERVVVTLLRSDLGPRIEPSLIVFQGGGPLARLLPDRVPVHDLRRPRLRHAIRTLIAEIRRRRPRVRERGERGPDAGERAPSAACFKPARDRLVVLHQRHGFVSRYDALRPGGFEPAQRVNHGDAFRRRRSGVVRFDAAAQHFKRLGLRAGRVAVTVDDCGAPPRPLATPGVRVNVNPRRGPDELGLRESPAPPLGPQSSHKRLASVRRLPAYIGAKPRGSQTPLRRNP